MDCKKKIHIWIVRKNKHYIIINCVRNYRNGTMDQEALVVGATTSGIGIDIASWVLIHSYLKRPSVSPTWALV